MKGIGGILRIFIFFVNKCYFSAVIWVLLFEKKDSFKFAYYFKSLELGYGVGFRVVWIGKLSEPEVKLAIGVGVE